MMTRIRCICNKGSPPKGNNLEKCLVCIDSRINSNERIVITQCNLQHKHHDVDPGNSCLLVGFRLMLEYFKRRAMLNDSVGMPIAKNYNTLGMESGGHARIQFNKRDLRNAIVVER